MSRCRQSFDPEGFKRFCQYYALSDDPQFNAQVEANEPIVSLLTEIRDVLVRVEDKAHDVMFMQTDHGMSLAGIEGLLTRLCNLVETNKNDADCLTQMDEGTECHAEGVDE